MKLAIFDVDGTLTNTNGVDDECFVKALAKAHAITEISTDWATYRHTTDSGITLQIFQEKFGRDPDILELDKLQYCFVNLLGQELDSNSSSFRAIPGASAALEFLRQESDWGVAIATGAWRESALLKLRAAKIDIEGIPAAFAEDGLSREEILLSAVAQALQHYRLNSFARTVSIGDGLWDIRTARSLRFSFVGVGGGEAAAYLNRSGAQHVIEDFSDYARFANSLNEAEIPSVERLEQESDR